MSVHVPAALRREVAARAGDRCEYCRIPAGFLTEALQVDDARPLRQGGPTDAANLTLACPACNLWKGYSVAAFDPATDRPVMLFNPRGDSWGEHFACRAGLIAGLTDGGRATVELLKMNELGAILLRRQALAEGFGFP